jgi:hypothetical protein
MRPWWVVRVVCVCVQVAVVAVKLALGRDKFPGPTRYFGPPNRNRCSRKRPISDLSRQPISAPCTSPVLLVYAWPWLDALLCQI